MNNQQLRLIGVLALCSALYVPGSAGAQASPIAAPPTAAATDAPAATAPAATPATPAADAPAAPAEVAPAGTPAAVPNAAPPPHPKWTSTDVARVRAMLRANRDREVHAPPPPRVTFVAKAAEPVVHGDAGAAISVGLSVDAVFNNDRGYDLFDDDDVSPRFGAFIGHDLLMLGDDVVLGAELGFGIEEQEEYGLLGGAVGTKLSTTSFFGALALRHVLLPWLQPHARFAVGASALSMELSSAAESKDTHDAVSPFASLGAGVLLRTPTRALETRQGKFASLSFGVLVEGGYALRGPLELSLGQARSAHAIALTQAKLGELALSGPYVRTSLVARF